MPRAVGLTANRLPAAAQTLDVVVGIIEDDSGRVLINQRRDGTHMAGHWEFPGGKRDAGETRFDALARELAEELGIVVRDARPMLEVVHDYPDRRVRLDVWRISRYDGTPRPREQQPLRWVAPVDLQYAGLLPADQEIVRTLLNTARA